MTSRFEIGVETGERHVGVGACQGLLWSNGQHKSNRSLHFLNMEACAMATITHGAARLTESEDEMSKLASHPERQSLLSAGLYDHCSNC